MPLKPFRRKDISCFLNLAAAEQWVIEQSELDFLLTAFPDGCLCMQDETGAAVGFISSLKHDRSGWIGNLVVRPDCRGAGIGEALFVQAMTALHDAGAETLWLTASEMGRPLYEKHGFKSIDRIIRWAGETCGTADAAGNDGLARFDASLDRLCWGDRRELLLEWTTSRGIVVAAESACVVIQPAGGAMQIGPCAALNHAAAGRVISAALAAAAAGTKVVCDAPSANSACTTLLQALGFNRLGGTHLMYAGAKPDYRPDYLYGLATMGSSG
jgi:ribosomal protein S18 acetylase RimI-like enzyme